MKTLYFRAGIFGLVFSLLLSSCSEAPGVVDDGNTASSGEKTPFIVKTVRIGSNSGKVQIEKSARIIASSSLILSSQSAGEVSKILVKEGQSVKAGSTLINIKDSLTNLDLRLEQAENAVDIQSATIETTKANLEISIENARVGLERAKQGYESLTSRNNIQYDTLVNTNSKTLDAYNGSYATYLADLDRSLTQILYEGDKVLGISPDFDSATDGWDPYLGVKVGDSRKLAVNAWNDAYATRGLVRAKIEKGAKFEVSTLTGDLLLASNSFESLRKYVDAMVYMIQNNVVGGGLSDTLQTGWITAWNGYRAQIQASEGGFNAWKSQVSTFIKTYNDGELATKLALESLSRTLTKDEQSIIDGNANLRVTYENARIDLNDKLSNAKLSLEQAEVGYKNAKVLREATLKQLIAAKKSAEITLEQAKREYAKLRVTAPLEGTITRIIASVGQTVGIGTPTLEISGKIPEILLDIDDSLAKNLEVGMNVGIRVDDTSLTGTITAVSQVSSSNLLSSLRIGVPTGVKYIGKSVTVILTPNESEETIDNNVLPLDAIHIISEGEGEINILSQTGEVIKKVVKVGDVEGENAEILTKIEDNTRIIISDITNYDPMKNKITIQ